MNSFIDSLSKLFDRLRHNLSNEYKEVLPGVYPPELKHDQQALRLAANPDTQANILEGLARSKDVEILERVAENPNTSARVLTQLAKHDSAIVRCAVADNANTPESEKLLLSMDKCADVRYRLAENPNVENTILFVLCEDENPFVVFRVRKTLSRMGRSLASGSVHTLPHRDRLRKLG